jgi:phage terminase large subunit
MGLSAKHQSFINSLFLHNMNATEAYCDVYGVDRITGAVNGSKLLRNTNISEHVRVRLNENAMSADEVIARLADIGRGDMAQFMDITPQGWHLKLVKGGVPIPQTKLIKKIKQRVTTRLAKDDSGEDSETIETEIELYSAHDALRDIGKIHGLFTDDDNITNVDTERSILPDISLRSMSSAFWSVYLDIADHKHTEYMFFGGRGSTKSSFISLVIIWLLVKNPTIHALVSRQVGNTLRDSVYAQLSWAIDTLGLNDKFRKTTSPLEIVYIPTGQHVYFRGADDPLKIKSIKPPFGYIGLLWMEELDQFHGQEAVRSIEQSAIRGGDLAYIFKSFNPPRTANNWANKYAQIPKDTQYQHKSDYRAVPPEWLGKVFLDEAEHLRNVNPTAYQHEYLGEVVGTGGMVFENVQIRKISDEEIAQFDHIYQGVDWGYYPDPFAWGKMHYDAARMTLYIFDELRMQKAANREVYETLVRVKGLRAGDSIIADSAEPKSVGDFRQYSIDGIPDLDEEGNQKLDQFDRPIMLFGPSCRGAEKGPESVKYSMKWLQSLAAIVIDNERCPFTSEEFLSYELEQDKDGNFISEYPDHDNHFIDMTRYALNMIWRRRGQ